VDGRLEKKGALKWMAGRKKRCSEVDGRLKKKVL
jgi:hypothetical protein